MHASGDARECEPAAAQIADAEADYLQALAAAKLQLVLDTDAAGTDSGLLTAAQSTYDTSVASAKLTYQQTVTDAQGDQSVADALATDAYVDEVYAAGGAYEIWQDAVADAKNIFELAESAAKETLTKNLATHDAALQAALADTYADALEQLAIDHPSPWAPRAAADARAESDRIDSEQSAQEDFEESVATADGDFEEAVANAEEARSNSQTEADRDLKTTLSDAGVTTATDQKATNDTAAGSGAGTQKEPEGDGTPEQPGDPTDLSIEGYYQAMMDLANGNGDGTSPLHVDPSSLTPISCLSPPEYLERMRNFRGGTIRFSEAVEDIQDKAPYLWTCVGKPIWDFTGKQVVDGVFAFWEGGEVTVERIADGKLRDAATGHYVFTGQIYYNSDLGKVLRATQNPIQFAYDDTVETLGWFWDGAPKSFAQEKREQLQVLDPIQSENGTTAAPFVDFVADTVVGWALWWKNLGRSATKKAGETVVAEAVDEIAHARKVVGSPEHKAQRWIDYQERGGKWDYRRWSKTYDKGADSFLRNGG